MSPSCNCTAPLYRKSPFNEAYSCELCGGPVAAPKTPTLPCDQGGSLHADLVWSRNSKKALANLAAQNPACEMLVASGFGGLARYLGVCPRCGNAVEWKS